MIIVRLFASLERKMCPPHVLSPFREEYSWGK
nr:unnamed protein product [Callosobruchus analis]